MRASRKACISPIAIWIDTTGRIMTEPGYKESAVDNEVNRIPIGVSSCLLGDRVRYDGGHKKHSYIVDTLGQYFEFRQFCPEMAIGMGVPRETIRIVDDNNEWRVQGVKNPHLDVTEKLIDCANDQRGWHEQICGYIVKKDSPSCGMERVKVYRKNHPEKRGSGLYTNTMMQNLPWLPVEEEGRLGDSKLRENFIQRVFVLQRWKAMVAGGVSWSKLTDFHARHKLIFFSHDQGKARALGRDLSQSHGEEPETYSGKYLLEMMELLKIVATPANHVNTLEHIRGYLKKSLDTDDKKELGESIENYRNGLLPLIVPITLLRHHFRKYPDPYIDNSWYLQPYPGELMLLNSI